MVSEQVQVDYEELSVDKAGRKTWNDQPFTGVAIERFADGKLRDETNFVDGLEDGFARTWHESGPLAAEATLWRGVTHGFLRRWDEAGRLLVEEVYEFGIQTSGVRFDVSGDVTERFELSPSDRIYELLELRRRNAGSVPR